MWQTRSHSYASVMYVIGLPLYTCLGALIFYCTDGTHDQHLIAIHGTKCRNVTDELQSTYLNTVNITNKVIHQLKQTTPQINLILQTMNDIQAVS